MTMSENIIQIAGYEHAEVWKASSVPNITDWLSDKLKKVYGCSLSNGVTGRWIASTPSRASGDQYEQHDRC